MPADTGTGPGRFSYPALRRHTPVLTRAPGVLQVGLDQEPSLALVDVPAGLDQLLALLDGCHHTREIRAAAEVGGIAVPVLDWALRTLDAAGLLQEGLVRAPGPAVRDRRVRLLGAGPLGRATAVLLARTGLDVLYLVDNEPPDPTLYPRAGVLGTRAEALRALLEQETGAGVRDGPGVRVVNHWSKPDDVACDLTVVASDRLECDRVVLDHLMRTDQPHLVLRPRAGGAVVGPLVLPGRTTCVRCTDLSRRDADPGWPTLLPQLQRTRMGVDAALAGWAGGVATAQILAFLHGSTAETCGATVEISPTDYVTHRRPWSMHGGCGCGWRATAQ